MWNAIMYYSPRQKTTYEHILALAKLSIATVTRDERLFHGALQTCVDLKIEASSIFEAILQTYLFAGYPTCLWGFEQFSKHQAFSSLAEQEFSRIQHNGFDSIRYWYERGKELFTIIYGNVSKKLYQKITALHPDLARWMITEGYGKVLMREGMPQWLREICIVAILGTLQHPQQAYSHLRGSLRLGVPYALLKRVLQGLHEHFTPQMRTYLIESLETLRTTFRDAPEPPSVPS